MIASGASARSLHRDHMVDADLAHEVAHEVRGLRDHEGSPFSRGSAWRFDDRADRVELIERDRRSEKTVGDPRSPRFSTSCCKRGGRRTGRTRLQGEDGVCVVEALVDLNEVVRRRGLSVRRNGVFWRGGARSACSS